MHFGTNLGNLMAPYMVRRLVSKPMEQATISVANFVDYLGSTSEFISDLISDSLGVRKTPSRRPNERPERPVTEPTKNA